VSRGVPWPTETVERALAMRGQGLSTYAIATQLQLPRASVRNWCMGRIPTARPANYHCDACGGRRHALTAEQDYAYLLGMYLGDGCLSEVGRKVWLCVAMDSAYPGIIDECRAAISSVLEFRTSNAHRARNKNLVLVRSYGREWLCLFPQHGPGRKHHRRIELAGWQREIVARYPGSLLRGLVHSDGWRGLNRVFVKGRYYAYPRYQFSNRSDDIRRIFTDTCDLLGVEWRRWGKWHISVARRDSVALLDEFVGPKA
jgi:hypothetical protein